MTDDCDAKPEEPRPEAPLVQIFERNIATDRRSYARAWHRAERVAQVLTEVDERLLRLTENLGAYSSDLQVERRLDVTSGEMHTLSLATKGSSDRLFIVGPPYDEEWQDFQPPGAKGTAARGPSASKSYASMGIDLTETYVDRPVAEGGWMWAGAGLGIWFKPKARNTYVRVSGIVSYDYEWADSSSLQVAHNRGQLCKLVARWVGPGNMEVVLDRRDQLWSDGTGWYEDHSDSGDGYWSNQDYFWASSDDWYLVWFWCNGGIDFATKTTFGSSKARQTWKVRVPFVVFEQFA